ncbi:MAG: hypothetical protein JOZ11_11970 [Alphaproteobacteria bacterium]|nr:hypothetical protein [Alphaproteobacteria bacterium]
MDPRVDLQVAVVLRGKPQLDATIGANMSDRSIAGGVLNSNFQQPMAQQPLADLASTSH